MLYLLQQGLCQWVDCDCVHGPVETDLHEPRRFKAGLRRVPSSLTSANSPIRTPAHPLPERYLARRKSAPRQGLSHVCPLVCARRRGGLCHRAVLCRYEQCRDGSREPRPITRLLDRGQSTKVLFLFSCGNQLTRRRFSFPPLGAVQPVSLHRHRSLLPRVPLPMCQLRRRHQPAPPTRLRL